MKKINLNVGFDQDGTLTNMSDYFYNYENFFNKKIVNKNAYDLENMYDVSKSKVIIWGLFFLVGYCKQVKINKSTAKMTKTLIKDGHFVCSITARKYVTFNNFIGSYMRKLVIKYNESNKIYFSEYNFCDEKKVTRDKYLYCFKNNIDIMFEDKKEVALYLANKGIVVGLVDAPYNQDVVHENIYRCKKYSDYEKLVELILKKKLKILKKVKLKNSELTHDEYNKLSCDEKTVYLKNYQNMLLREDFEDSNFIKGKKRYKFFYNIIMILTLRALFTKVKGKENLPFKMDVIYVSNHLDSMDQFSIVYGIKNNFVTGFAANTIENTFRGKIFKFLNSAIFIDRSNLLSKMRGMRELEKLKIRGASVIIFPEGTRKNKYEQYSDKEILEFKPGAFNLAQKTSSVILPVTLHKKEKRSMFTTVIFDKPFVIKPDDNVLDKMDEIKKIIINNLRKEKNYENK